MLILLCGEDTFRSRQKLNEIVKKYQDKHRSGLNLSRFKEEDLDMDKIKERLESISMFDEKKLLILENAFKNKNFREDFLDYVQKKKIKGNQDVIIAVFQTAKMATSRLKNKFNMLEEFNLLKGAALVNWIKKETIKRGGTISPNAAQKLAVYAGGNLWQTDNEIDKLLNYSKNGLIKEEDVDLLVKAETELDIFRTLDALAQKNKRIALKLLHEHLAKGENEIYLFTMFVYQIRNLLKLKDLAERGIPYYSLAKQSGLHPFVVKKNWPLLKNFELERLKKIYQSLLSIEFKLKTGRLDGPVALDLLVMGI